MLLIRILAQMLDYKVVTIFFIIFTLLCRRYMNSRIDLSALRLELQYFHSAFMDLLFWFQDCQPTTVEYINTIYKMPTETDIYRLVSLENYCELKFINVILYMWIMSCHRIHAWCQKYITLMLLSCICISQKVWCHTNII